jgi:NAD(P)H-hydrate epimerase
MTGQDRQGERIDRAPALPPRDRAGHKGTYGHVLVVGGSEGMIGAAALTARASLRGGAGLVTMALPRAIQPIVAPLVPCATSVLLDSDERGRLTDGFVEQLTRAADAVDVLAVGPGMGRGDDRRRAVLAMLNAPPPAVLDADALNLLATVDDWPERVVGPVVLTPHPGEFSRLTGLGVGDIQADRQNACARAARRWRDARDSDAPLVCALKGAGTVVSDGERVYVNDTGNPGMATGGAGDVLTGLVAALIGQGFDAMDAAMLGVHAHGLAGDLGAGRLGEASLTADDIVESLPEALRRCGGE